MRSVAIVNPAAGGGKRGVPALPFAVWTTQGPKDGVRLAEQAVRDGYSAVYAVGGDGTISEVAQALAGTETALGIVPWGTGNDLARHLGLHPHRSLAHHRSRMDVVRWSCATARGIMLNVAGCGIDAAVAECVNREHLGGGTWAYLRALAKTFPRYRPFPIELEVDGATHSTRAWLCAVANSRSYGGGMRIAPDASVQDGLADAVLIGETSVFDFLRTFPRVFSGRHVSHPAVNVYRAKRVAIRTETPQPFFVDGDIVGHTPVEFEVWPDALWFLSGSPGSAF